MSHARRPRDIYPSLYGSRRFRRLNRDAMLLFHWMIVMGDDEGRGDLDLELLGSDLAPLDPMTHEQTHAALRLIDSTDIAKVYQVDGEWYYQISNPLSKVRPDRFKASTYPSADCGESRRFAALFSPSPSPSSSPSLSPSLDTPLRGDLPQTAAGPPAFRLEAGGEKRKPEDRDNEYLAEAGRELRAFVARAEDGGNDRRATLAYLRAAVAAIDAHYAHAGGSFTARRKLNWLRRMSSMDAYACLIAMEIYTDLHSPLKDYRWQVGIARRLSKLDHNGIDEEAARHRAKMDAAGAGGLFVRIVEILQQDANGPESDSEGLEGPEVPPQGSESP